MTDHFLVKTIIKQRLIITPRRNTENRKKWNLDKIRNPVKLKKYRQTIYEKILQKMEQKEVNHEWKNIKSTILESADRNYQNARKAMSGGTKNVKKPSERKILPKRNVYN